MAAMRESRESIPACCASAAMLGGPCPVCGPPTLLPGAPRGPQRVAREGCAACAQLAREVGRALWCQYCSTRWSATPPEPVAPTPGDHDA